MVTRLFKAPLELLGEDLGPVDGLFLEQADGGHVGERLDDADVVVRAQVSLPNRLRAPMTRSRRRSGRACTERKPSSAAWGANTGQRSEAWRRSRASDGDTGLRTAVAPWARRLD
jgi:hypothetical protein